MIGAATIAAVAPRSGYRGRVTRARGAGEFGTIAVVLEVLRGATRPLTVREIVDRAGRRLRTRASTEVGRHNVVSRDLCRELARGDASRVIRIPAPPRCTTWAVRS